MKKKVVDIYYNWLVESVCNDHQLKYFQNLLTKFFETEFYWILPMDANRAVDGIELCSEFLDEYGYDPEDLGGLEIERCSLLEMLVALAKRIEFDIMEDPDYGDRTGQWFWIMIKNMGLGFMDDGRYDEDEVEYCISRMLERDYDRDGRGGLFHIEGCSRNLRRVDIWQQANLYLNTIT